MNLANPNREFTGRHMLAIMVAAVLGGGAVAADCATTAKRLGAASVELVYRRRQQDMPLTQYEREMLLDIFEMVSGQRMMSTYFRPGGVWRDLPDEFIPTLQKFVESFPKDVDEYERLLNDNPLWIDRTQGIGVLMR